MKIATRKHYKNADEGVILEAIQIAVDSDPSVEQRRLRVQHTCSPVTSPTPWSSKERGRGWGRLRLEAARRRGDVGAAWYSGRASPSFAGGGGGVGEGEGCALDVVRLPSIYPSIYRAKGKGGRPPPDGSGGGGAAKGEGLPPKPRGAPPLGFPPTLGA